jgi:transaldolase
MTSAPIAAVIASSDPSMMEPSAEQSPLKLMTVNTPTRLFNDSCATSELRYSIERGATGATSNPVICLNVLRSEKDRWLPRVHELIRIHSDWNERQIAWTLYTEMGAAGAELLLPTFNAHNESWGRLSVQTDPTLHNNSLAMVQQSIDLSNLGRNMQVKIPATAAGIGAIEEATFHGVNLNVTVSFCVPQVLAISEAIERGLRRRDAAGLDNTHMVPVATMMIGRLDDWLKLLAKRDGVAVASDHLDWAGIACAKRAYQIMRERNYRTKLLIAAYRHLGHWSELVGGDMVQTMPWEWQVKANQSGLNPINTINTPVDPTIVSSLQTKFPDFVRAYEPDGMTIGEFDSFGPTRRTLRSFIAAWYDFVSVIRDVMIPDPD